jgi:hypothetical protein
MRNAITVEVQASTTLATSYGTPVEQPASLGALIQQGGQCILSFIRTGGTDVTFKIDEYFGEKTGWVAKTLDTAQTLTALEVTSTLSAFSYAFPTLAEKIRVYAKDSGAGAVEIDLTVGDIN